MARTLFLLSALLIPVQGWAQSAQPGRWDVGLTAGAFEGRPGDNDIAYQDKWYFAQRYAASVGRYWTEHLKTEVEFARSGEDSVYLQEFRSLGGQAYPYGVRSFHRVDQLSTRMVWQFGHNAWVHPYINGGLVVDRDRQHLRFPAQYQVVNGRTTMTTLEASSDAVVEYRIGATAGAGAKLYLSRNAFFNTGFAGTWSQPSMALSLFAGFGFDF